MGVVINITSCRTCVRLRVLLESRDYECADCTTRRLDAMSRSHDMAIAKAAVALWLLALRFVTAAICALMSSRTWRWWAR